MDQDISKLLAGYQPSKKVVELVRATPILLLVGPTGAGKDSLKGKLLKTNTCHHIVSHTTREPRINHGVMEVDGQDYHFIDKPTAIQMLKDKAFVEAKIYSGNIYGTSASEIAVAQTEGKTAMTDVEVQGVAEYKNIDPKVMAVFMLPPSFKVWQDRLSRRYGDVVDAVDHRRRLQAALDEISQLLNTNYYMAVVNDDLEQTCKTVSQFIGAKGQASVNDEPARKVARQLARDIQAYLDQADQDPPATSD